MDRDALRREAAGLVDFARGSRSPLGFGRLDVQGRLADGPVELWVTCRMTHVFALAAMQGDTASLPFAEHGVAALTGPLHDDEHGGWFAAVDGDGPTNTDKEAYGHAFVVLAASSAQQAGITAAGPLLAEALSVIEERFWDPEAQLSVDSWDRGWHDLDPYRGVNANMHLVEAMLAAHDATGERRWLDHALAVVWRVVHEFARGHAYRLPEHFTETWQPLLDYNHDEPAHPFRPYGVTIGHLFEWARLTLQVRHVLGVLGEPAPEWMLPDALALFDQAVEHGWLGTAEEGGWCYTADFEDRPVVRERMHWVMTEAMGAAWVLHEVTGEQTYAEQYDAWLANAQRTFVDPDGGSWWHELDEQGRPSTTVWAGKPDVYHAYQSLLTPLLPLSSSYAGGVRAAHPTA